MAHAGGSGGDQHLPSVASNDSFGRCMSATLADLVSRPSGDVGYLSNAINIAEEVLAEAPSNLCIPADVCKNLSVLFERRYQQTKDLDDLQAAITWAEQGVVAILQNIDQVLCLSNLIVCLVSRYEQRGELEDLCEAVMRVNEIRALDTLLLPNNIFDIPIILNFEKTLARLKVLCASVFSNFKTISDRAAQGTNDLNDLNNAILLAENLLIIALPDYTFQASYFKNLSTMLHTRYIRVGNLDDLQKAITFLELANSVPLPDDDDRAVTMSNLGAMLVQRFEHTGDLDDLQRAILQTEEAMAASPLDHPNRSEAMENLSGMLRERFKRTGDLDDLQRAILRAEELVTATSLDHPDRASYLNTLSTILNKRFKRTGDLDDLQQAILRAEEAVAKPSRDHLKRVVCMNNLSSTLYQRFQRTGDLDDLERAIVQAEEVAAAFPLHHPMRAGTMSNLCFKLIIKFEHTGNLDDLQRAIFWAEESVTAALMDHPHRAGCLTNLSTTLKWKFKHTGDLDDFQRAILSAEEAVAAIPLDHPDRAISMINLGDLLSLRYKLTETPHDRECAVHCLRECVALKSATPTNRISGALRVTSILEEDKHWTDASEMTETAVSLLPRVSSRSLGQKDQQHMMKQYAGLASRAAAVALQAGKSATDALKTLEIGRGVIANLQFETRTDLTVLREQHPQVAKEFEQFRDDLDSSNSGPLYSTEESKTVSSQRHATSLELEKTVNRIRLLPNFERFLLPPTASELTMAAAFMHPVVLINVSSLRCDAFIIQQHNITTINLPRLREANIRRVATAMKSRTLTKHQTLERLKWLWDILAGPVLEELGFLKTPTTGEWPRVCWIPTGPLCLLPIHAAGYHCETSSRTVLDRVVSSYCPSIKALLYARRNEAQRNRSQASVKAILVSMGTTPGCSELPFVEKETNELHSLFPASIPRVTLNKPCKKEVLSALEDCSIFHFAGHGQSHPSDPSMSTLLMADWQTNPLTVRDLVTMKFHRNPPLLAYLSACSTGDNKDVELLDEGIHLMGACQLAGFRHVIGSLWEVSDKHCVDAAKDVYNTMTKASMSDASVSQGLHNAVLNLRDGRDGTGMTRESRNARLIETEETQESMIGDPFIWAAYIHMGI